MLKESMPFNFVRVDYCWYLEKSVNVDGFAKFAELHPYK